MKQLITLLFLFVMLNIQSAWAQELTVQRFALDQEIVYGSTEARLDGTGEQYCALVLVQLSTLQGVTFDGEIVNPIEPRGGEYWVYMVAGSKYLRIKHPSVHPLEVKFADYGVGPLQPKATYVLTINVPQVGKAQTKQYVTFAVNPAISGAEVTVNGEVKYTNSEGKTTFKLLPGHYTYQVKSVDYSYVQDEFTMTSEKQQINVTLGTTQRQLTKNNQVLGARNDVPSSNNVTANASPQTFTVNGVSFTMIPVQGGTFEMGATPEQEEPFDDEKPVHSVTLSSYSIGETEVTQALWKAVMGRSVTQIAQENGWKTKGVGANYPMYYISWDDCQWFIQKLNSLTGVHFRLPTEAEWEYAARGGNQSRKTQYAGSSNIDKVAWYDGNSGKSTHKVKTKMPNELGLYDMSGNVLEWCQDWFGSYSDSTQTNPTGPTNGSTRVRRGGGWYHYAEGCRSANRIDGKPANRSSYLGLRLAL